RTAFRPAGIAGVFGGAHLLPIAAEGRTLGGRGAARQRRAAAWAWPSTPAETRRDVLRPRDRAPSGDHAGRTGATARPRCYPVRGSATAGPSRTARAGRGVETSSWVGAMRRAVPRRAPADEGKGPVPAPRGPDRAGAPGAGDRTEPPFPSVPVVVGYCLGSGRTYYGSVR